MLSTQSQQFNLGFSSRKKQNVSYAAFSSNSNIVAPSWKTEVRNGYEGDRFIPTRSAMNLDTAHFNILRGTHKLASINANLTPLTKEYKKKLAANLLEGLDKKILSFKRKKLPIAKSTVSKNLREIFPDVEAIENHSVHVPKWNRYIPQSPERILDAPDLLDNYYLNLLDWGPRNVLAVGLGPAVYLWDAELGNPNQLMQIAENDDFVTSVAWAADGIHIAIGTNSAGIQLWNADKGSLVRRMGGHSVRSRVGSLAWNGPTLSSGSQDCRIINHDVRARSDATTILKGHNQEVCGLKWSLSGQQLASGGNDNLLHIWDVASLERHLHRLRDHQAAVKALAWCPSQSNVLASGGGSADRCIKIWNTQRGTCLRSHDTHSQVSALIWNQYDKEILSSHGYDKNQLCLWRYPSMMKITELTGHTARVLHLSQSPEGTTVVSAAGAPDETLRFWKVFTMGAQKWKSIARRNLEDNDTSHLEMASRIR